MTCYGHKTFRLGKVIPPDQSEVVAEPDPTQSKGLAWCICIAPSAGTKYLLTATVGSHLCSTRWEVIHSCANHNCGYLSPCITPVACWALDQTFPMGWVWLYLRCLAPPEWPIVQNQNGFDHVRSQLLIFSFSLGALSAHSVGGQVLSLWANLKEFVGCCAVDRHVCYHYFHH